MLNVGGWNSLPGAEARGALGTVPSGLHATLYLHPAQPPPKRLQFFYHIILSPSSATPLLSLRLLCFSPRLLPPLRGYLPRPDPHDIQGGLFLKNSRVHVLCLNFSQVLSLSLNLAFMHL